MASLEQATAVLEKYAPSLRQLPFVAGVSVSLLSGDHVIMVMQKRRLQAGEFLPTYLDGVRVVSRITGEFRTLDADRTLRWRPAPGGVSIGHPDITAGTLGCVLYLDEEPFILGNNHILGLMGVAHLGDPIIQPGSADGGLEPEDVIATLYHIFPMADEHGQNVLDAALARPTDLQVIEDRILGLRPGDRLQDYSVDPGVAEMGMPVVKSGRTTGLTAGVIESTSAVVDIQGYGEEATTFYDCLACRMKSLGGDSGSAVLSKSGKLLGLLFAGSDDYVIACKITNLIKALPSLYQFREAPLQTSFLLPVGGLALALGAMALSLKAH